MKARFERAINSGDGWDLFTLEETGEGTVTMKSDTKHSVKGFLGAHP
jgi:hypothetical protein